MKLIKSLVVIALVIGALGFVAFKIVHVEASDADLPEDVYEEDSNLLTLVNLNLFDLFIGDPDDEYTVVEEIINLVILEAIRENINTEYDPLGDCETIECNYIEHNENFYINYLWAELNDENQIVVYVSIGSDKIVHVNTIVSFYLDIEINYIGFEITLTLDKIAINKTEISVERIDKIMSNFDKGNIEDSVSVGELDLDEYKYTISFSPLP